MSAMSCLGRALLCSLAVCTSALTEQADEHLTMLQASAQLNEQIRLHHHAAGCEEGAVDCDVGSHVVGDIAARDIAEFTEKHSSDSTEDEDEAGPKQCRWIGASAGSDGWCNSNCNHNPPYCPAGSCDCSAATPPTPPPTPKQCRWIGASAGTDAWCNSNCNHNPAYCPAGSCDCSAATPSPPPPTAAPTVAATPAPTCPVTQQCYAVGDPHYLSSFGAGKFDFMGKGLFQLAANNEGSFKVQAVQCPANNGNPGAAIFKAFALLVNGDIITIIDNEVLINGQNATTQAGGYTISGAPDATGVTVATTAEATTDGCTSASTVNIRKKAMKFLRGRNRGADIGWRFDMNLKLVDASSSYGICTGAVQTSQPDCNERLFTEEQLQQIATACGIDVPDCASPTPVPPPTPPSEICTNAGADYAEALQKCTDGLNTNDDVVIQACVLDYCTTGDDDTIAEFNTLEPTPPPSPDCADGTCTIAEDPHINVFDGRQISLLQGQSHLDNKGTEMLQRFLADGEEGDMWLVKSSTVSIQARYARDDTLAEENLFVKSLAVSGDFMKGNATRGNKLVVGDLEQGVTFNGLPILVAEQSDFQHNAIIKAKRHLDSSLVQNPETVNPGINVELPEGVKLLINRQQHYINVMVTMPPAQGGQDGLCGNFNGDADDDSLELIEARDPRVAAGESLF